MGSKQPKAIPESAGQPNSREPIYWAHLPSKLFTAGSLRNAADAMGCAMTGQMEHAQKCADAARDEQSKELNERTMGSKADQEAIVQWQQDPLNDLYRHARNHHRVEYSPSALQELSAYVKAQIESRDAELIALRAQLADVLSRLVSGEKNFELLDNPVGLTFCQQLLAVMGEG